MTGSDPVQRRSPGAIADTGNDPVVGTLLERAAEWARIAETVVAGGILLIEGPAGIGKTSLLDAAAAATPAGTQVLRACGRDLEAGLGFGAVRELLCPALFALGADDRAAILDGPAGFAAPVLGAGPGQAGDPLFGLYWLVAALAERSPLLLLVDDLHWADAESLRFLAYLAPRCAGLPLALVAATRPVAADPAWAAIRANAAVLTPQPLSAPAVAQLLHDATDAHAWTGGNPLLVRELAAAARELPELTLSQVADRRLPEVFLGRLHRMPPAAVELARTVALFPDGVGLHEAGELAGLDDAALPAALDTLTGGGVLIGEGDLRLAHPLLRTAVLEELAPTGRRTRHRRAVDFLRARGAPPDRLLPHLLQADSTADPEDAQLLLAAAREAELRRSPGTAAAFLLRLLDEPATLRPDDATVLARIGALQAQSAHPDALHSLRRAIAKTPDGAQRWALAVLFGKVACESDPVGGTALLLELRSVASVDRQTGLALDAVLAQCAHAAGDMAGYENAVSRLSGDLPGRTEPERLALAVLAARACRRGEPATLVCDLARRSLRDPAEAGDVGSDADDQTDLLVSCGDLETGERLSRERAERAARTGASAAFADAQLVLTVAATMRGALVAAEGAATLGLDADPPPRLRWYLTFRLAEVLLRQGRLADVDRLYDALAVDGGQWMERLRGSILLLRGDHRGAVEAFDRARGYFRIQGHLGPAGMGWTLEHVHALAATGHPAQARELAADFLAGASVFGERRLLGLAWIAVGVAADPDADGDAHARAHALLVDSPHRWEAAVAALQLGRLRRRGGERDEAKALLEPTLAYAEAQRASPLAEEVRNELRALGLRPERRSGSRTLTPAQDRVARLAASGLTNREIAQRTFLTVKTVEMHLSAAFRVLGIASRAELARALSAPTERLTR
ncbi:MAG: AAA family ATPase [Sporichthyaceae bacterium]